MHVLYEGALAMPTRLCYDNVTGGIKPPHKILLDYTTILVFTQNSGNSRVSEKFWTEVLQFCLTRTIHTYPPRIINVVVFIVPLQELWYNIV